MFLQAELAEVVKFINQCNRDYYLGWTFCGEREGRAAWYRDPEVFKVRVVPLAQGVISYEYDILPSGESGSLKGLVQYLYKRFSIPTNPNVYKDASTPEMLRLISPMVEWLAKGFLDQNSIQHHFLTENPQLDFKNIPHNLIEQFKIDREREMIGTAVGRAQAFLNDGLHKEPNTSGESKAIPPAMSIVQEAGDKSIQVGYVNGDLTILNITTNESASTPINGQSHPIGSEPVTIKSLQAALSTAKRALVILEEQAAGYTSLTIPVHLKIELEDKRKEVQDLESKINEISKRISSLAQSTDATC